ncbi:hypothetical protein E3N88_32024 [Mikania micrantha]|uniref:Uncharacterized protein n=1 Tax=Mikania micrantha TaxID=192012 RepID=A0A5N6M795_9ASTR|nr:hypothetical protein E3N88_32024 [Mikania micrantha]
MKLPESIQVKPRKTHQIFAPISSESQRFLRNICERCTKLRAQVMITQKSLATADEGGEDRKTRVRRGVTPADYSQFLRSLRSLVDGCFQIRRGFWLFRSAGQCVPNRNSLATANTLVRRFGRYGLTENYSNQNAPVRQFGKDWFGVIDWYDDASFPRFYCGDSSVPATSISSFCSI